VQGGFRGTAVDLRQGVLQQLNGRQDLEERERKRGRFEAPLAKRGGIWYSAINPLQPF
jgi:hypothetical protein